jgi:two-component system OmpR family response regulator
MITPTPTYRVLIVEEDYALRDLLCALLQEDGYQAEAVSTLGDALSKISERRYDVVLTDLLATASPLYEDNTSLHSARQLQRHCHPTPIGILTAWPIDLTAAEREGFAFALAKPFDSDHVLQRIARCLNAPCLPGTTPRADPHPEEE